MWKQHSERKRKRKHFMFNMAFFLLMLNLELLDKWHYEGDVDNSSIIHITVRGIFLHKQNYSYVVWPLVMRGDPRQQLALVMVCLRWKFSSHTRSIWSLIICSLALLGPKQRNVRIVYVSLVVVENFIIFRTPKA